jgi:hypothetical protein
MSYSKPQVSLLGDARTVIEYMGTVKTQPLAADAAFPHPITATTAYDLDE